MKNFLLIIIKMYWYLVPAAKRKKCLFTTSCSNYVYEVTKKDGLISGFKALKFRVKNCNPNYDIIYVDGKKLMITATHQIFKENEIRKSILN